MKTISFLLPFIFSIAIIPICKANSESDSLSALLQKMPKETNYVRVVEKYVWYLINPADNQKKADSVIKATKILAKQIKDFEGLARIHWYDGFVKYRNSKANEAISIFKEVESLVQKHNLSKTILQKVYAGYGISYSYINQYDVALKYCLKATELTEKYHLRDFITQAYNVISKISYINEGKGSLEDIQKIRQIAFKDTDMTMRSLAEINIATHLIDLKRYSEATPYIKSAEYYTNKYCRKVIITDCYGLYFRLYWHAKKYNKAYIYLLKAKYVAEKANNPIFIANVYAGLGRYYLTVKNYKEAEKYLLKVVKIDQNDNYGFGLKEDYELLSQTNVAIGNYKKAFEYQNKAHVIDDSLFSKKLTIKINRLEKEKQTSNIKLLEIANKSTIFQRNVLIFGGILTIISALIIIVLLINRNKYKKLEAEQKLRNQIASDLHDEIGSTLSSISILSEIVAFQQKKGDSKLEIMQQVSYDAREVIDKMDDIIWTINPQNDSIHNLETRLKSYAIPIFESKEIEFKIDFSAITENIRIDISKRRDIYLILKEAVNNLVKYSKSKNAIIEAKLNYKSIVFEIIDNGVGFDVNTESQRNGLKNMKMRAEKIGATLNINSIIGKGTQVTLTVPL